MYTEARGINGIGQISGSYQISTISPFHGFLFSNGNYTSIDVPGSVNTSVGGINNLGQIVGAYRDPMGKAHGFLRSGDTYAVLDFPGDSGTQAYGINNGGGVVGLYGTNGTYGFVFERGSFSTLDVPGSVYTDAVGINDSNQIVGTYRDDSGFHGYLATPLAAPVPEPSSLMLLALGTACVLGCTCLRRRNSARA